MNQIFRIIGSIAFCILPSIAWAQSIEDCHSAIDTKMAIEHRIFRSVLFGEPSLSDAPVGHTIITKGGTNWLKVDTNKWQTASKNYNADIKPDSYLNDKTALVERRGIFNTKRTLTSELIPSIIESTRTFDCRLQMYCSGIRQNTLSGSASVVSSNLVSVTVPGCETKELPVESKCMPNQENIKQSNAVDAYAYCTNIAQSVVSRELDVLKATVEYDAAYRSTLQFAGTFDQFISQLRWPMVNTIKQVVSLIGIFHRLPCFIASCDDFPFQHPNETR